MLAPAYHPAPRLDLGSELGLGLCLLVGLMFAVGAATPHRPTVPPVHIAPVDEPEPEPTVAEAVAAPPAPARGFSALIGGQPARDRRAPQQSNAGCFVDPATGQQTCPGVPIGGGFFRRR